MLRSFLVLLLLANYLLVVGAGLVERPAKPIDRPFAYVHRPDCQLKHTLRLACFDDCNGVQYTIKKTGERLPLQQLLNSFKGLDAHCLAEAPVVFFRPFYAFAEPRVAGRETALLVGYRGEIELPPRRG
ncbi:hypothetical protein [Hymenobacter ruricola]|uniref:Uncharacterized protein n=1 Tax=Hymenobacter ruricola TaxID=2791023 RepID=A0ABS0HXZ6_9BACT|nr:hypothetical protein [Hymenobacter ruricola]MBF9219560.1 hypothetical protein [Hymenobacter ruricola]